MEKEDVLALIRSLLTCTSETFNTRRLLREFKEEAGCELPLFGYRNVSDFLRSIPDTVRLVGDEVHLVKSERSAHVVDLVDNQRVNTKRKRLRRRPLRSSRPPPRNDTRPPRLRNPPPRHSSYSSRSYTSSSLPPRLQQSYSQPSSSSAVFISPYEQSRLHDFLKKFPDGATFEEVTRFMLDPGDKWSKYYIQDGVPELVDHCGSFCTVHAGRVFTNDYYKEFMRKTKVQVSNNGYMPGGNESDYSTSDEFYEDYDEDDEAAEDNIPTQQYSNKPETVVQLPKKCDIRIFKNRLGDIVKKYPTGIWCSELFHVYQKFYDEELEFHDYGYNTLIDMLSDMPDTVSCTKATNNDWIVYGVTENEKIKDDDVLSYDSSDDELNCVKNNVLTLLRSKNGIEDHEIPPLYYKTFKKRLNYEELGFENFRCFINSLENVIFFRVKSGHNPNFSKLYPIVAPAKKPNGNICDSSSAAKKIPTKPEGEGRTSLYPEEVLKPKENIAQLDLRDHARVGQYIEVCVADVYNPSKFFLYFRKFKSDLYELMEKLQSFYNSIKDRYQMPEETLVPDQICAALYDLKTDNKVENSEWHRARIVKVLDENRVYVNLIDYGTLTKIEKSRLRFLNKDFATLPCQAFTARLANTEPAQGLVKWSKEANKRFLELIYNKDLIAGVVEVDHKNCWMSVALSITLHTEIHISETLVAEGLARFSDELGNDPSEQRGPKKIMKNKSSDIFELEDEPEIIHEIINTSTESDKSNPEIKTQPFTTLKNPLDLSDVSILNPIISSASALLNNTLPNPTPSAPLLPNLLATETLLNYTAPTATIAPATDPATLLINKLSGLSLNSTLPPGLSTKAPPPGFSSLLNPQQYQEELKQKINAAALQLFLNQPEIRLLAQGNPTLALQIALQIAEDYYKKSEIQNVAPQPVPELITKPVALPELITKPVTLPEMKPPTALVFPSVKTNPTQAPANATKKTERVTGVPRCAKVPKRKIQVIPFEESSPSDNETSPIEDKKNVTSQKQRSVIIKESRLRGKNLHIIIINRDMFILVEEVIRNLTAFSSKERVDQIIIAQKCTFKYQTITQQSDPDIYEAINKKNIQRLTADENEFTLLPLKSIVKYLRTVQKIDDEAMLSVLQFVHQCEDGLSI